MPTMSSSTQVQFCCRFSCTTEVAGGHKLMLPCSSPGKRPSVGWTKVDSGSGFGTGAVGKAYALEVGAVGEERGYREEALAASEIYAAKGAAASRGQLRQLGIRVRRRDVELPGSLMRDGLISKDKPNGRFRPGRPPWTRISMP